MDAEIKSSTTRNESGGHESRPPKHDAARRSLQKFVGEWKTEGVVKATGASVSEMTISGRDSYEWLPGQFFLLHRVEVRMGESKVQAVEIIGYDQGAGHYVTYSFDSEGTKSEYTAHLDGNDWKIFGKTERFSGCFSNDGNTLSGTWEKSEQGTTWQAWMQVTLTRIK
jgi:hypothetical protein